MKPKTMQERLERAIAICKAEIRMRADVFKNRPKIRAIKVNEMKSVISVLQCCLAEEKARELSLF